MYLLDNDYELINAECSLDTLEGEQCIIIESSGGGNSRRGVLRRNPGYNLLVSTVLTRLARKKVRITRIVLDSTTVAELPINDRIAQLDHPYPIDLTKLDIEKFRRMLGRTTAGMHQAPGSKSTGNAQKRVRICLEKPISPDALQPGTPPEESVEKTGSYAPTLSKTEQEYIGKARLGQGQFRQDLLKIFRSTCPLTGISNPDLLIASHIKPWRACNNSERLDPYNGILLSALADRLFDKGFISFEESGEMIVSKTLLGCDLKKSGINTLDKITLDPRSLIYLRYHRGFQLRH